MLNINNDSVVSHTNLLEKLHRSALPVAIRTTLNSAAFDVKTNTMPKTSEEAFTVRQKNFFKANSRVELAKGFDVKSMKSKVGFIKTKLKGGDNFSVDDLRAQEYGGIIHKRSFIPTDAARGGNKTRPVRPSNRLSKIKIVNSNTSKGRTRKQRFTNAAIHAGKGGHVLGNFNKKRLYKVISIRRVRKSTVIKTKAIYTFEKNRQVRVKATGFMRKASLQSAKKMENWYIENAKKQIMRLK